MLTERMTPSVDKMEPFELAKFIIRNRDASGYEKAHATFLKEAHKGNPEAQYCLGLMLARGQGVDKNYPAARIWFEKAESNGNMNAA